MNMKQIKAELRPVKMGDIRGMMIVNEASMRENYSKEFWRDYFNACKPYSFVVWADGGIIGYIYCNGEMIISFAVSETYRNQGVGNLLLQSCLNCLYADKKTKVGTTIKLHTRVSNRCIKLYKIYGFTGDNQETVEKDYYTNEDGTKEDAYVMTWDKANMKSKYEVKDKFKLNLNAVSK
jgi:ribosomal protein S18 acetylase RimI-like enzyme